MASGAKIGNKTLFQREIPAGSGTYVTVAEVKELRGPSFSRDKLDATNFDSTDDYGEKLPGLKDGGEISATLNFRPEHTSQGMNTGLLKAFEDGTVENWRVQYPQFTNSPQLIVRGFLTGWEVSATTKELMTVQIKLEVTGKPTPSNFA